jgi:hypothetical protein
MLEREYQTYCGRKDELLRLGEGKYVLIGGTEVAGFFDTNEEALEAGFERYGIGGFLVQKVEAVERPRFISRLVCPTSLSK